MLTLMVYYVALIPGYSYIKKATSLMFNHESDTFLDVLIWSEKAENKQAFLARYCLRSSKSLSFVARLGDFFSKTVNFFYGLI